MTGPWHDVTMNEAWDGYIPSRWHPPSTFEQRAYWEWWRCGVIEGRVYGSPVTDASQALRNHSPRMAGAYENGMRWVWARANV